ncbi:MAG: rod shape-determining protein MreC [Candidatus Saganbacteria bacterium]|nr:rod shape-determining protein MreC [Candidatus Saganbacteria bacterium]
MIRFRPYRKKRSYALTVIVIILALALSFTALRGLFGLRSALQSLIYPFQYTGLFVWRGFTSIPAAIYDIRDLAQKNKMLKERVAELEADLLTHEELTKENERLRDRLGFEQNNPYRFRLLPAQVLGRAPSPWFSLLQINQGSLAGVKTGQAVVASDGLAGQIIEVSQLTSKMLLLTDSDSAIAAVDARSRDLGVLCGSPSGRLVLKFVAAGGDVRVGDQIVTSHISSIFPPGIPLGIVVEARKGEHDLFYHIEVQPAVGLSRLEEVFVVK